LDVVLVEVFHLKERKEKSKKKNDIQQIAIKYLTTFVDVGLGHT